MDSVTIVGGGLAGCECAFQLAERGVSVVLHEQKPEKRTEAQSGDGLAELVCSNSFRGAAMVNAVGVLKEELRRGGSVIMASGAVAQVPAGGAFAVDRDVFSAEVTRRVHAHPLIEVVTGEVTSIPDARPCVLATGPLTSDALAADLARTIGQEQLAYYDAIAPVVTADSLDWDKVYKKSRYDKGGDAAYVNCPFDEAGYHAFIDAIVAAEKVEPREFEKARYFEGCLPIEVTAERGPETLAHGCMKPVGLEDPRTGQRAYAVVQLRQENKAATAYNLVGFQTRMKWPEQKRIFRTIPGLENAVFERLGSVHRNTFVNSPAVLADDLSLSARPGVYLAGQLSGVEGYVESAACGFVLGVQLARELLGLPAAPPPIETALGALVGYLRTEHKDFQPSNVIWSMFPPAPNRRVKRRVRREQMAERALAELGPWLEAIDAEPVRARVFAGVPAGPEVGPTPEATLP